MPASKTHGYNATQDNLKALMAKLKEAHGRSERLEVAKYVVTKTGGNNLLHVAALHGARDILKEVVDATEERTDVDAIEGQTDVDAIEERTDFVGCMEALSAQNTGGYTPLHYAASRGSLEMCKDIISREGDYAGFFHPLIHIRNNEGETPLFLAALHGHRETFLFLHRVNMMSPPPEGTIFSWIRKNGDTILHCTISREYFDLSFQIVDMYKDQHIATVANERGITPLHVLANKRSAFKSGTPFNWFSEVLYNYTTVEKLKRHSSIEEIEFLFQDSPTEEVHKTIVPENYGTCLNIYGILRRHVVQRLLIGNTLLDLERNSSSGQIAGLPPNYYPTWIEFVKYVFGIRGYLHHIKLKKEKHVRASQVMEELIPEYYKTVPVLPDPNELMSVCDYTSSSTDVKKDQQSQQGVEKMTPLLTAAKNGVIEMVTKILEDFPLAIHETTADKKNVLLVAAESGQPRILKELKNHHAWDNLIQAVDDNGNNVLHLAAQSSREIPAVQMQWEIKWYQFVKNMVPRLIFQTNNKEEIPNDIFIESHRNLAKEGSDWLKDTSGSCSVVAVLVAGALFTTSNNVPGGINDQTGEPTLLRHPEFTGFAIISMAGLCFSVTSLVTFLVIRISKQQPSDFKTVLPLKLFVGFSFLFLSIICMLGSFSASFFILLQGRMSKMMSLIYVACLPIPCFMVLQLPVYWDLFKAFSKSIPWPTDKKLI